LIEETDSRSGMVGIEAEKTENRIVSIRAETIRQHRGYLVIIALVCIQIVSFIRFGRINNFHKVENYTCDTNDIIIQNNEGAAEEFIYINAKPTRIGFYFTKSDIGKTIEISISQGESVECFTVIAEEVGFLYVEPDGITEGEMDISVRSDDIALCQDLSFGSLKTNDQYAMVLSIDYETEIPYLGIRIAAFFISIAASIVLYLAICGDRKRKILIGTLAVIELVALLISRFATTLFSGEAYFEIAGEYINNVRIGG